MKKVFTIILVIALIFILGVSGYFIVKSQIEKSQKDETPSFAVYYNEVDLTSGSTISIDATKEHVFNIEGGKGYTVSVVPCDKANWLFLKDGKECNFLAVTDLTSAFNFEFFSNYFTMTVDEDFTLLKVLETAFPDSEIVLSGENKMLEVNYCLEVKAEGEEAVFINFRVTNAGNTGVVLDKTVIKF